MTKVNKTELVTTIAAVGTEQEDKKVTKVQAAKELAHVLGAIQKHLQDGESVALAGFANFNVIDVPETDKINNLTGEPIHVAAHQKVKVKVSPTILD